MEGSILGGFAGGTLAVGVAVAEAPVWLVSQLA